MTGPTPGSLASRIHDSIGVGGRLGFMPLSLTWENQRSGRSDVTIVLPRLATRAGVEMADQAPITQRLSARTKKTIRNQSIIKLKFVGDGVQPVSVALV